LSNDRVAPKGLACTWVLPQTHTATSTIQSTLYKTSTKQIIISYLKKQVLRALRKDPNLVIDSILCSIEFQINRVLTKKEYQYALIVACSGTIQRECYLVQEDLNL